LLPKNRKLCKMGIGIYTQVYTKRSCMRYSVTLCVVLKHAVKYKCLIYICNQSKHFQLEQNKIFF